MGDVKTPQAWQLRGQAKTIGRLDMNDSTRRCSACGVEKPETPEHFYFRKGKRVGLKCASCVRAAQTEYRRRDPQRIRDQRKRYAETHKQQVAEGKRRWYENNRPPPYVKLSDDELGRRRAERQKIRRAKNAEREAERYRLYAQENREAILARRRQRYRENAWIRVRATVSARMQRTLKFGKDGASWESLVGYTINDLVTHLESLFCDGMTWSNYCHDVWHIDHIRPVSSFDIESPESPDFAECWELSNLRPLWAKDNMRKGAKWNPPAI